ARQALALPGDALPAALVPGVLALVRVDLALAWTTDPAPRAWAGGGAEVYARALAPPTPGAALTLREARP
ncbi:MAG TPA: hypothetical protein VGU27_09300, partial [Candidatus Eisenbacteria bacterium]|nr:hypothetical protein [Candidatus Eisenbacteria bacterium]